VPAKKSQAGFDGSLAFESGGRLTLSLKRYGASKHEQEFQDRAEVVRRELAAALKGARADGVALTAVIDAPPTNEDWDLLRHGLVDEGRHPSSTFQHRHVGAWSMWCGAIPEGSGPLAAGLGSYLLQVIAPFHPNEDANLGQKLLEACSNLAKYAVDESDVSSNVVYVRVDATANLLDLEGWAHQWFVDFPSKAVSAVLLYQPSVTRNELNESLVHHCYRLVMRPDRQLLTGPAATPQIVLPMGRVGVQPATVGFGRPDGQALSLDRRYVFQRGDIFREMLPDGRGGWTGGLGSPAPGVHEHGAVPRHLSADTNQRATLAPLLPRIEDLVLV
jgi:hypothetical protein